VVRVVVRQQLGRHPLAFAIGIVAVRGRAGRTGTVLAGAEGVAHEKLAFAAPAAHREDLRLRAARGLVPHVGVVAVRRHGGPGTDVPRCGGGFERFGPAVVGNGPERKSGADQVEVFPFAGGGVVEEVARLVAPQHGVGGEEIAGVCAHGSVVAGDAQVGGKGADEQRPPVEHAPSLVVGGDALRLLAGDFELRFVEEDFEFAAGGHRAGRVKFEGARHALARHAAEGAEALGPESAQALAELRLVGEACDPERTAQAFLRVEVLGVGEAHPATAQADDEVRCHNLGRETARAVPAADRARARADTRPQTELFAHRGDRDLPAIRRAALGRHDLDSQFRFVQSVECRDGHSTTLPMASPLRRASPKVFPHRGTATTRARLER
jgi:hypothetical protein